MVNDLPNIYYVTYRFGHHNVISSYPVLPEYVRSTNITTPPFLSHFFEHYGNGAFRQRLVRASGLTGYFSEALWLESLAMMIAKLPQRSVIHYIHPENSYFFLSRVKRSPKCKVVASYHQPVQESRQFILKTDAIRQLDAVVILSESQREFFEPIVGPDKLFLVPHGVNVKFFTPAPEVKKERRIISVGGWLRDFETLAVTMKLLQEKNSGIICDVVTGKHNWGAFAGLKNVEFHAGISNEELRNLYRRASISVMCLNNAVANQGMLESMSCGLPLIATDITSVREYSVPEGCRYVDRANPDQLAEAVISLMDDTTALDLMGKTNAVFSQKFGWEEIAKQMEHMYSVISGR
jgi:glycosyltransferase involved in cell wall biosynthesis